MFLPKNTIPNPSSIMIAPLKSNKNQLGRDQPKKNNHIMQWLRYKYPPEQSVLQENVFMLVCDFEGGFCLAKGKTKLYVFWGGGYQFEWLAICHSMATSSKSPYAINAWWNEVSFLIYSLHHMYRSSFWGGGYYGWKYIYDGTGYIPIIMYIYNVSMMGCESSMDVILWKDKTSHLV